MTQPIPTKISVDETPWMAGWPPLVRWLEDHGLDPALVTSVEILQEGFVSVVEYMTDGKGNKLLDRSRRHVVCRTRVVRTMAPYPYCTEDGEVLVGWRTTADDESPLTSDP